MWNVLPLHVTSAQSPAVYRQRLIVFKTFLFPHSYPVSLYDLLTIIYYYYCCCSFLAYSVDLANNRHHLGHVQRVDDNDDDDDDDLTLLVFARCHLKCTYQDVPLHAVV